MGKEPIWSGGAVVSYVTSAAYGYSVGRGIVYGYLPAHLAGRARRCRSNTSAAPRGDRHRRTTVGPQGRTPEGLTERECAMSDDELDLSSLPDEELSRRCTTTSTTASPPRSSRARTCCSARAGPERVLNEALVEGMRIVGIDFRDGILFVPEVLLAANAMKAGMEILRPLLAETGAEPIGKVVIGTVKGDIHDIGKNLVAMMLEGAGFEVIDLGINNPVERYLAALEEHQPDILGMSALLTTTMPYMKVVIDELKARARDDTSSSSAARRSTRSSARPSAPTPTAAMPRSQPRPRRRS